jgi:hypothetical protein
VEVTKEIIDCSPPFCGSLRDPADRHSLSPSSRVRASARSTRCQPASPSKVDRKDEAAFCAAKDPEIPWHVVAITVGAFIPYYWLQLFKRRAAALKAMAHRPTSAANSPPIYVCPDLADLRA